MRKRGLNSTGQRAARRLCICCQQLVSARTEYRHRILQAPPRIKASSLYINTPRDTRQTNLPPQLVLEDHSEDGDDIGWQMGIADNTAGPGQIPMDIEAEAEATVGAVMLNASQSWNRVTSVEDDESEEEVGVGAVDIEASELGNEESSELSLWDQLGESFERDIADIGESQIKSDQIVTNFTLLSRLHQRT